jgi:hypothetical protein
MEPAQPQAVSPFKSALLAWMAAAYTVYFGRNLDGLYRLPPGFPGGKVIDRIGPLE